MWKLFVGQFLLQAVACFSPLAGIRYVETRKGFGVSGTSGRFSPLAGIRYVETRNSISNQLYFPYVSVPLRGLDMWKPRRLKHNLGAESRSAFGGPLKKPYYRLRVKHKLKL